MDMTAPALQNVQNVLSTSLSGKQLFFVVVVTQFFHTLSLFRFHLFRKSDCIWSPEPGAKLQFNTFNSDEKWQIKMTHVANLIPKNVSRKV